MLNYLLGKPHSDLASPQNPIHYCRIRARYLKKYYIANYLQNQIHPVDKKIKEKKMERNEILFNSCLTLHFP